MANAFEELLLGGQAAGGINAGGPINIPQGIPAPKKPGKGSLILGIIADALAGAQGRAGPYAAMLGKQREAEAERVNWGLKREADLEDYGRKLEMQNDPRYAKPESRYWEDNAGNQWKMGANGQPERFFTDMAPKQYIQDGMLITAPNPYNTGTAASPPPTIGEAEWQAGLPAGGQTPASGGFPRRR